MQEISSPSIIMYEYPPSTMDEEFGNQTLTIPVELFESILSNLGDIKQTSLVSRTWRTGTVIAAQKDLDLIKYFSLFVDKSLNSETDEIQEILETISLTQITNPENPIEINNHILSSSRKIIQILTQLSKEKLDNLEQLWKEQNSYKSPLNPSRDLITSNDESPPMNTLEDSSQGNSSIRDNYLLIENIFIVLSRNNQLKEQVKQIMNRTQFESDINILIQISIELIQLGCIDSALQVVDQTLVITNFQPFEAVAEAILQSGSVDRAVALTKKLDQWNNDFTHQKFCVDFSLKLAAAYQLEQALEIANLLSNKHEKEEIYKEIIVKSLEQENFSLAIKIAKLFSTKLDISSALQTICKKLVELEYFDQAIKVAESISTEVYKTSSLITISNKLLELDDLDETILYAKTMPQCRESNHLLIKISKKLILSKKFKQAIDIVKTISQENWRDSTLHDISIQLIEVEQYNLAIESTLSMNNEDRKQENLGDLLAKLVELGQFDLVSKNIHLLIGSYSIDINLESISRNSMDAQRFELAIKAAKLMSPSGGRDHLFFSILNQLIKFNHFDLAIAVVDETGNMRGIALDTLYKSLLNADLIDSAIKVIKKTTHESIRDQCFNYALYKLVEAGQLEQAIKVADLLSTDPDKYRAYRLIIRKAAETRKFDLAMRVVRSMPRSSVDRDRGLDSIANELIQIKDFDRATEMVQMISDEDMKDGHLLSIALELMKIKDFDRAQEVAQMISNENLKVQILDKIQKLKASDSNRRIPTRILDLYSDQESYNKPSLHSEESDQESYNEPSLHSEEFESETESTSDDSLTDSVSVNPSRTNDPMPYATTTDCIIL